MAKNKMGLKTKAGILDAAETIFRQHGFEESRVEDIAWQAGVTKAMIYYHFESKEGIMLQLIARLLQSIQQTLPIQTGSQGLHEDEKMQAHLQRMLQLWEENQQISAFLINRAFTDPVMFQTLSELAAPFFDSLIQLNPSPNGLDENRIRQLNIFCFNTLPMIFYPLLRNQLMKSFNLSEAEINQQFIVKFIDVFSQQPN